MGKHTIQCFRRSTYHMCFWYDMCGRVQVQYHIFAIQSCHIHTVINNVDLGKGTLRAWKNNIGNGVLKIFKEGYNVGRLFEKDAGFPSANYELFCWSYYSLAFSSKEFWFFSRSPRSMNIPKIIMIHDIKKYITIALILFWSNENFTKLCPLSSLYVALVHQFVSVSLYLCRCVFVHATWTHVHVK